ncbi:glycosyltransferase [Pedobacter sp. Leaf194]|uniref:glycosyltransferase family 2 protein n=1 Tax=Pedobacter sp. Leaf194 TaxID=1736297 RepID=UPI0007036384|nr:glycosyltransferase [Pedobacter sp. Leaf194]KQS37792.1 hypothetical protein ASG14_19765 [Pedobacter sp. Leaf194]
MTKPLLSVVMITYGHQDCIEQAVDSVLMQVGEYDLELIIANDRSLDRTDDVVKRILDTNERSHCIKYFVNETNLGIMPNLVKAMQSSSGKYIAICEGDDYWTDKHKLQKQLNFLENNAEYSMVCHNAMKVYEGIDKMPSLFTSNKTSFDIPMSTIINKWIIPTASMFFRRKFIDTLPNWVNDIYSGDYTLALLLRHKGKVHFMNETMSVYRINYSGSSASALYGKKLAFVTEQQIRLLNHFDELTSSLYAKDIRSKITNLKKELRFYNLKSRSLLRAFVNMPFTFSKRMITRFLRSFQ